MTQATVKKKNREKRKNRVRQLKKIAKAVLASTFISLTAMSCSMQIQPPNGIVQTQDRVDELKANILAAASWDVYDTQKAIDILSRTTIGTELFADLPSNVKISIQNIENGEDFQYKYASNTHYVLLDDGLFLEEGQDKIPFFLEAALRRAIQKEDELKFFAIKTDEREDLSKLQMADSRVRDLIFAYEMNQKNPATYPSSLIHSIGIEDFTEFSTDLENYRQEFITEGRRSTQALSMAKSKAGAKYFKLSLIETNYSVQNQKVQGYPEGWPVYWTPDANTPEAIKESYSNDYIVLADKLSKYFCGYLADSDIYGESYTFSSAKGSKSIAFSLKSNERA